MTLFRRLAIAMFLALAAAGAGTPLHAANCVEPGGVLDVPRRGYLRGIEPNLTLDFRGGLSVPITPLSVTASRIRIRLPASGMPDGQNFKVRHHPDRGPAKVVANARTCPSDPVGPVDPPDPVDPVEPVDPPDPAEPTDPTGPGARQGGGTAAAALAARGGRIPFERATAADVAAPSGAPEYLLAGSARDVARADAVLLRLGIRVLRRTELDGLGLSFLALDLNGVVRPAQLRSALARAGIPVIVDRHSVYRAADGGTNYAAQLVGLNANAPCRLPSGVRVGIIDGPIDATHPALTGVAIRMTSVLGVRERQGSTDHATGIAALIAGPGSTGAPAGIAPGAQLYSVVAFARNGGRDIARLENIAAALDWLIRGNVGIVNLSLAGPENATLAEVVRIVDEKGIVMIAAAGNNGRPQLAYPASDPRVIAITAIDANRRLYRKANSGAGLDFAAPGVDVQVPGARGTSYRSGTSYAAAIATAVAAHVMARGVTGRGGVDAALRANATDLGPPGPDEQFGWGLISAPACR